MRFTARKKLKGQSPLISCPGEQDTIRIRYREAHAFKNCRSTITNFGINPCLDECVGGHGYLQIQQIAMQLNDAF